jgi:uracil-DNA glycosylase
MVVGQDYYTKAGYLELRARGDELHTQTWRGLRHLLRDVDYLEHGCFFTNAWMGLRTGAEVTGRYAGAADAAFTARCARFLARQIAVQRPRLVVTLGAEVPALLARLAPALQAAWGPMPTLGAMDASGTALVRDVAFPGTAGVTAHVVALVHPSLRNANVRRRHFRDWSGTLREGHEAEVALLRAGLEALGVDRW